MTKSVTGRQLIIISILSIITLKVLFLPNVIASNMGRDGYLFLFFLLLFDFAIFLIFLFLMNKFPDKTFYQLVSSFFGTFFAKIIMLLLFFFFLIKCWTIFQTSFIYLNENLYTTYNWYVFAFPLILTVVFCALQGVRAFGRLCEFFVPVVIAGFLVSFFVGVFRADFTNILPFMENGLAPAKNLYSYSIWFGDYTMLIVFLGKIKFNKSFNLKISLSLIATIILISCFYLVFYCTYDYNSVCHTNAISDILQILPSSSDIGSFDWILILIWDIALFLDLTLNLIACIYCFKKVFFKKFSVLVAIFIMIAILIVSYSINFNIYIAIEVSQNYLWIFNQIVQVLLPLIIFVVALFKRRSINEVALEK